VVLRIVSIAPPVDTKVIDVTPKPQIVDAGE